MALRTINLQSQFYLKEKIIKSLAEAFTLCNYIAPLHEYFALGALKKYRGPKWILTGLLS